MTTKEVTELLLNFLQVLFTSIAFWGGVALLVFIFVFRNDISNFLKRLKQFKTKGLEVNTGEEKKKEEPAKDEEPAKEEKKEEEKAADVQKVEGPKNLDDWRTEMIFAAIEKNQKRADEAFEEIKKLNEDVLSKKKDEILYLKFSYTIGKTDAISRIKGFLIDADVVYEANMALGFCYANSDDFENSANFYSQALENARCEEEKAITASQYSSSLYRDNKKEKAIKTLIDVLSTSSEDANKIRLYEALANIYEKENDQESRAFVLDKAVELKPNDTGLIFKVGYSYAESGYDELSLLHYKNAQDINPEDEGVQNNLGVQYDNLKMPIKSISSYRKAERLGYTLASANLAYRLINAGFTEEAKEILNSAVKKEDVHPNVNSALSDLPKRIEKEDEVEKDKLNFALKLRKFFLGFTEAKFVKSDKLSSIRGEWKSETGTVFQFNIIENKLTATWNGKLINYEYDWKLEGDIFNNSSVITIYEKEYNFSKSEYEYRKKGEGFLFCIGDGNKIKFIKIDDLYKSKKIYVLTKNSAG